MIHDHSPASFHREASEHRKKCGAFRAATMGEVLSVGLNGRQAAEYDSDDEMLQARVDGMMRVVDAAG